LFIYCIYWSMTKSMGYVLNQSRLLSKDAFVCATLAVLTSKRAEKTRRERERERKSARASKSEREERRERERERERERRIDGVGMDAGRILQSQRYYIEILF